MQTNRKNDKAQEHGDFAHYLASLWTYEVTLIQINKPFESSEDTERLQD